MEKVFESICYVQLGLIIIGQLIMTKNPLLATVLFCIGNCIAVTRAIMLRRPISDKIKDGTMLAISIVSTILAFC